MPWAAAREHRLHPGRGAARTKDSGGTPWKLPFEAIVAAAACHERLGMPYRLLSELLGAHESTISLAARRITPILEKHGITRQPPRPPKDSSHRDTPETANLKTDAAIRVLFLRDHEISGLSAVPARSACSGTSHLTWAETAAGSPQFHRVQSPLTPSWSQPRSRGPGHAHETARVSPADADASEPHRA